MRIIAVVPTYNEAQNVGELIDRLRGLPQGVEVLVADDNSPDGTAQVVRERAQSDPGVHLLLRTQRKGRGYAGAEGLAEAFEMGAELIIEMDGDLSHRPEDAPTLIAAAGQADVIIGSRTVRGGRDEGRPWFRRMLTALSCFYARSVLRVPVGDINSGYRLFNRRVFQRVDPRALFSAGPSIVHEINYRARLAGLSFAEVPIRFVERRRGSSELTVGRLIDGYLKVLTLWWMHRTGKL
ncbi:MAG: polyprenol monophosphomannose synthase [Candidatus Alcyoniella australis]|nr:polyprenol monophosphomannose synthase [Candidatus Alcyoniella australis]